MYHQRLNQFLIQRIIFFTRQRTQYEWRGNGKAMHTYEARRASTTISPFKKRVILSPLEVHDQVETVHKQIYQYLYFCNS
mmetsp:Transcript_23385/g.35407  ORF Transcript_23385/g.35407 Transcript_23385/m.35407 type:complete len:80 (-) Transcript_23385:129-368(-)